MLLRRKSPSGYKNTEITSNGKLDSLVIERQEVIRDYDVSSIPEKQQPSASRSSSGSITSSEGEQGHKEGKTRRGTSSPSTARGSVTSSEGEQGHKEGKTRRGTSSPSTARGSVTSSEGEQGHKEGKTRTSSPSTARGSVTSSEGEQGHKEGKTRTSSSCKGLAHRRSSKECVIPGNIDLSAQLKISQSPTFKIEDFSVLDKTSRGSRPITLQRFQSERRDCISIRELSESPQHYVGCWNREDTKPKSRLSVDTPHDSDGESFQTPSSPLLVAMRNAVDSLNQYEDFEILEEIGAGFFAQVFKVRHKPTGQLMVLKRNKRGGAVSLLKEVELLKRLQHPNILHYVGACIHEGQLHPLTEYISGGTLEELIQHKKRDFPWDMRLLLSLDIAMGMEYLHQHGMFHRDLNSRNVLLRRNGSKYTAVVADFGLAAKTIRKMHRSQSIVGTPYWMAPEVLNGKPYNETADVFSYGIVLCEIITRLSADPDEIPRSKDYGLDEVKFRKLPEVTNHSCPQEFMELAFISCKLLSIERPSFKEISTRLHVIRDLHNLNDLSQESTDAPIRLSYHMHQSGGLSPSPPDLDSTNSIKRETSV